MYNALPPEPPEVVYIERDAMRDAQRDIARHGRIREGKDPDPPPKQTMSSPVPPAIFPRDNIVPPRSDGQIITLPKRRDRALLHIRHQVTTDVGAVLGGQLSSERKQELRAEAWRIGQEIREIRERMAKIMKHDDAEQEREMLERDMEGLEAELKGIARQAPGLRRFVDKKILPHTQAAASQQLFRDLFEEAERLQEEIAYISGDFRLSGPEREAQKKPLQQRLDVAEAHLENLAKKHGGTGKLAAMLGLGRERDFDRERAGRIQVLLNILKVRRIVRRTLRHGSPQRAAACRRFDGQIKALFREDPELRTLRWRDLRENKAMLKEARRQRRANEQYMMGEAEGRYAEERKGELERLSPRLKHLFDAPLDEEIQLGTSMQMELWNEEERCERDAAEEEACQEELRKTFHPDWDPQNNGTEQRWEDWLSERQDSAWLMSCHQPPEATSGSPAQAAS